MYSLYNIKLKNIYIQTFIRLKGREIKVTLDTSFDDHNFTRVKRDMYVENKNRIKCI